MRSAFISIIAMAAFAVCIVPVVVESIPFQAKAAEQWVDGEPTLIAGTAANDILEGTRSRDQIEGYDGDDILIGYEADDELAGGCGNDDYRFGWSIGRDVIIDSSRSCQGLSTPESNIATFTYYFSSEADFSRDGDSLLVDFGRDNVVRIPEFFGDAVVSEFRFNDRRTLLRAEVLARFELPPRAWELSNLLIESQNDTSGAYDCVDAYRFSPLRRAYGCNALFQGAGLRVTATAPQADLLRVFYKQPAQGRCRDLGCRLDTHEREVQSGKSFSIPGYDVTYGDSEEITNYVQATLRVYGRGGQTTDYTINLRSGQQR